MILIVEDNAIVRALYESVLSSVDTVLTAGSLAEARAALFQLGPQDVIVADYTLPDGTGLTLLEEADLVGISGLLVTGATLDPEVVSRATLGGWVILAKPVPIDRLRVFVEHLSSVASLRAAVREEA